MSAPYAQTTMAGKDDQTAGMGYAVTIGKSGGEHAMAATDWEKRGTFAKEYAISGNGTQAAIVAGVPATSAHSVAYKWLRNTDILALIREEIDSRLRDLGPVAVDVMRQVMVDPTTPANTRLTAARDILDRLGWVPPRRGDAAPIVADTPIEEMSQEELMAIIHGAQQREAAANIAKTAKAHLQD